TTAAAAATTPAPPAGAPNWAVYHGGPAAEGATTAGPSGRTPPAAAWNAHVDGQVYAEPVAAAGVVIVATESDVVSALDATTGAVRWSTTLGPPVKASTLPCGDIAPTVGVTSTPAVDPAAGVVHVLAFIRGAGHQLITLDLATGAVRSRVAADPPGLSPAVEQQRAALALANGRVYVAYGGLYGDCGAYKGAVVSFPVAALDAPAATSAPRQSWVTTASREAAVWGVSGPTVMPDGSLFISTGNAGTGTTFDGGDAVVHLSPGLTQLDVFAPVNWRTLATTDQDLGSSSPIPVAGKLVQAGKAGVAYLLDPAHLGGVGGQLAQLQVCDRVWGGAAAASGVAYLPCRAGVVAVAVSGSSERVLWRSAAFDAGGPVLAGGSVWVPDLGGGDLVALDAATGKERSRVHVGPLAHFATAGLGAGHLVVATLSGTVVAY
ncbi:MAG TPA: PQQ-binding-like beta-propeller repeat protein, partial [Acidimicrobiales bacterium]